MPYDFHDRLTHNQKRFNQINTIEASYQRHDGTTISSIQISPILRRPSLETPNFAQTRYELSRFGIELNQLTYNGQQFVPEKGDRITTDEGVYEVISPTTELPSWEYTTFLKSRIVVYAHRLSPAP